jgi:predicted RNase H-like HicB family nuclease
MKRYAVVIEKTETGYGANFPDLPGCVAAADTLEETERLIQEAIEFHLEGMRAHRDPIPDPTTIAQYVDVSA